jgi:DNA modification methylase
VKPWLQLQYDQLLSERVAEADEDVHFTQGLAEIVIDEYTSLGQVVLDPFAGYGTTLVAAERMGRHGIGVELLKDRVELITSRLNGQGQIVNGDARQVGALVRDRVDLCFTSPPYMRIVDHPENPLNAYETMDGDYPTYLRELGDVFRQVAELLRPGGHLVINAANMTDDGVATTLAWDLGKIVAQHLTFVQETFICWDTPPEWLTGDYCLVFTRPA